MLEVRTRFAPSPTGYLHIGGLRTALYAYLFAKKNNGKFILRIEDTDLERFVEGATELIYSSLKDAGLIYDEGPDVGGKYGPYIQSMRKNDYLKYAQELVEKNGAYYCFCSKDRLEELTDKAGIRKYDKHCLKLSKEEVAKRLKNGEPYVIRQNVPESGKISYNDLVFGTITIDSKELEDNVLIKSDKMPTYNFANVVDDHLMNITHVIRGEEYLSSTPKYNLLYESFGWKQPVYMHLPPVMRDSQHKLSKRYNDPSHNDLISEGYLKDALINYIALLGWSPKENKEKFSFDELKQMFSTDGLSRSCAIFDKDKLTWLNSEYIKELNAEKFNEYARPWYEKSKIKGKYDYLKLSKLLISRTEVFSKIPEKVNFLEEFENYDINLFNKEKLKITVGLAKQILPKIKEALEKISDFNEVIISDALKNLVENLNLKTGQVFWTLRIAITGAESTPGGAVEMADILGKKRTIERVNYSIELLSKHI
ncbi:MAG: glutamate--tRNA ligase [Firmicutes bacterium]|nr:glutamate--tRNA ligase [Bacillota bacterium]